jgi:CheY-like chemotaxis protein
MPGMDGPQTLAALRGIDPSVRAVFVTGHAGDYTREDLLGLGAEAVFDKPFTSLAGLAEAVRQRLNTE